MEISYRLKRLFVRIESTTVVCPARPSLLLSIAGQVGRAVRQWQDVAMDCCNRIGNGKDPLEAKRREAYVNFVTH